MSTLSTTRSRARSLVVPVLGAALTVGVAVPVVAADDASAPTLTDLGPAAVGTAVNGAELVGDDLYLVSRQAVPSTLTTLDLAAGTVTHVTTIPSGIEGWAATAVNNGVDLYVGMHTPADLYHYDTTTGTLDTTPVTTFPRELLVMDQSAAPDDVVYIGGMARATSGGVYAYDPADGSVEDLGTPAPGQRYVRSIVANEDTVFAGMGPAASIRYRDRAGGEWSEIAIPELQGQSFVYDMALEGRFLTFGTEPGGLFGVVDTETMDVSVVPVPDGRTVDSIVIDSAVAYFTVRPEGTLYSYDLGNDALTEVATPSPGAEHRRLFISDGRVIGVGGAGDVWFYGLGDGSVEVLTSIESNMPRSPERGAQSLTVLDGDAYVGGHWGIQRHGGTTGDSTRFAIPGETKTMVGYQGLLYASIYPASQVWTYDPDHGETDQLAVIRDNQMRPRASHVNEPTGSLLVGTREVYGNVGGAVSVVDPVSGDIGTHRDIVVDQTPTALTSIDDTAFVGHEIYGEVHAPTTTEAHLAAWDIGDGSTHWDIVPVPGAPAITGLVTWNTPVGALVYGLTSDGWLFAVDPDSGQLVQRIRAGSRATDLVANGSGIHALVNGGIFRVASHAPNLGVELLDRGSFTHLTADDTSDQRLYAAGIRTVDAVSMARLFAFEEAPTRSTLRWSVIADGELQPGSTFRVTLPDDTEALVADNGPLDADPDGGQFLFVSDLFGHFEVQQRSGVRGYLLDRATQHARSSMDEPSPTELVFVNHERLGAGG